MTPKEKANQLYNKMVVDFSIDHWQTKQCALVAQTTLLQKLKDLNIEDSFEEQVLFEINML